MGLNLLNLSNTMKTVLSALQSEGNLSALNGTLNPSALTDRSKRSTLNGTLFGGNLSVLSELFLLIAKAFVRFLASQVLVQTSGAFQALDFMGKVTYLRLIRY